jgi:hypothetical protein
MWISHIYIYTIHDTCTHTHTHTHTHTQMLLNRIKLNWPNAAFGFVCWIVFNKLQCNLYVNRLQWNLTYIFVKKCLNLNLLQQVNFTLALAAEWWDQMPYHIMPKYVKLHQSSCFCILLFLFINTIIHAAGWSSLKLY